LKLVVIVNCRVFRTNIKYVKLGVYYRTQIKS
jgi:hypothetical protein